MVEAVCSCEVVLGLWGLGHLEKMVCAGLMAEQAGPSRRPSDDTDHGGHWSPAWDDRRYPGHIVIRAGDPNMILAPHKAIFFLVF